MNDEQNEILENTTSMEEKLETLEETKEEVCEECNGTGKVTMGEFDDIKDVSCPYCTATTDMDDDMDDDSLGFNY